MDFSFFKKNIKIIIMLKDIRNFINGSVYGMTLIIPGVSATLFAIILKFYDEIINVINHFRKDYRKNARYLGVFLLGIAAGTVIFSSVMVFLLQNYLFPTMLLFTGLLTGIIPLIAAKAKGSSSGTAPRKIALTLFSLAALVALSRAMTVTVVNPAEAVADMNFSLALFILAAGIINGATLVIPGLSGAFILIIMGLYPLIIYSVSYIAYFFLDMGNLLLLRNSAVVLLPFGGGALIGFFAMARLMEKLLRDFQEDVYAVILGLLLGSVIIITKDLLAARPQTPVLFLAGALLFCAGCAASYVLGKKH